MRVAKQMFYVIKKINMPPKLYQPLFVQNNRSTVSLDSVFGADTLRAARVCRLSEVRLGRRLSNGVQAMMLLVKSGAVKK